MSVKLKVRRSKGRIRLHRESTRLCMGRKLCMYKALEGGWGRDRERDRETETGQTDTHTETKTQR